MQRNQLLEAVREIAFEETDGGQVLAWDHLTSRPGREVSELEFTSRFWGYIFGVAYGIAREDRLGSNDSNEEIAALAFDVACEVFNDENLHGLDLVRALEAGKAGV